MGRPASGDFRSKFAALLDDLRRSRGLTQADVAAAMGRHQSRLSKWRAGTGAPTPADLARLVEIGRVTYDYLCDPDVGDPVGLSAFRPGVGWGTDPGPGRGGGSPPPPAPDALDGGRGRVGPLTAEEALVLAVARRLGPGVALDRLIRAPVADPPDGPA